MNAPIRITDAGQRPIAVSCDTAACTIRAGRRAVRVSPTILVMVALLVKAYPNTIPRDRMMSKVFSGKRAHKDPAMCLRQTMHRARAALRPLGLNIHYTPNPAGSDLPGFYSLVRRDEPSAAAGVPL